MALAQKSACNPIVPLLVILSLALQIACAVHVVRSGRPLYWIWILFIGSYLALIGYFMMRTFGQSRSSSRKKGNTLYIVLLGAALWVIGYILSENSFAFVDNLADDALFTG